MKTVIKPGQVWESLRNQKRVTVIRVNESGEGTGVLVSPRPGSQKWLSLGVGGIKGYKLVKE